MPSSGPLYSPPRDNDLTSRLSLLRELEPEWAVALHRLGVEPRKAEPLFDALVAAYSRPERAYHNLSHLAEMIGFLNRVESRLEDPGSVYAAAFYHHAVHDVRAPGDSERIRSDNKERSVELARRDLAGLGVGEPALVRIELLILSTKDHKPLLAHADVTRFLDADLAILASDAEVYDRYARGIRSENQVIPEDKYRSKRAAALRKFLERDPILHHAAEYPEKEWRIRINLAREIAALERTPEKQEMARLPSATDAAA